jgi:sugar phosphate isomerase/epimerase
MSLSRRKFIAQSSLTLAGTMMLSKELLALKREKDRIMGIQLYSVRDDMKSDPLGTLKKLSAMGYRYVEHANYIDRKFYGYSATDFKKVLSDLGLKMPSGHTVLSAKHWDKTTNDFTDEWKYTVEDAATAGEMYVISPWLDESLRDNYDELIGFLGLFNKSGELCQKHGMKFGYHNHNFEFKDSLNGKLLYDIILDNTDPNLVIQQMDIGNMYGAGGRALDILKKHPGRFKSMHVKDEIKTDGPGELGDHYDSTVLGKGVLPVHEIVDQFKKLGGTTEFIIEQESYQGMQPLDCAEDDLRVMKSWGY